MWGRGEEEYFIQFLLIYILLCIFLIAVIFLINHLHVILFYARASKVEETHYVHRAKAAKVCSVM